AQAVSGVTKPASSIRSSAIRWPSGPTTAIETGTPISLAFSIAALMNLRHSTPRNFALFDFPFLVADRPDRFSGDFISEVLLFPKNLYFLSPAALTTASHFLVSLS